MCHFCRTTPRVGVMEDAADTTPDAHAPEMPTQVMALQPVAVVDHVVSVGTRFMAENVLGEVGGSKRVDEWELTKLLDKVEAGNTQTKHIRTRAGGSAANTARGLSKGFGVRTGLVGAVGDDEWGAVFLSAMRAANVDVGKLVTKPGKTGRCVCLVDEAGQRTMRTNLGDAVKVDKEQLTDCLDTGATHCKWLVIPGYAFYNDGLVDAAVDAAKKRNVKVALALSSFEVVNKFRTAIETLIRSGEVHTMFANEDEAAALLSDDDEGKIYDENTKEEEQKRRTPYRYLDAIQSWAPNATAVCTLGDEGCVARSAGVTAVCNAVATPTQVKDTTGAGDLFVSGFLAAAICGESLQKCARLGCIAGAAATQCVGAEVSDEVWDWVQEKCCEDFYK